MTEYHLSRAEQETHIWYDATGASAHIYTANPTVLRKLDKLCAAYPDVYSCHSTDTMNGKVIAKNYSVGRKYISFRTPASEKQKEAARKALARIQS